MTRHSDQYRTDTRIKHASGIIVKLYEWHRDGNLCHQNSSERDIILMREIRVTMYTNDSVVLYTIHKVKILEGLITKMSTCDDETL